MSFQIWNFYNLWWGKIKFINLNKKEIPLMRSNLSMSFRAYSASSSMNLSLPFSTFSIPADSSEKRPKWERIAISSGSSKFQTVRSTGIFASSTVSGTPGLLEGNGEQLLTQVVSILVVAAFALMVIWILGKLVDVTIGLRVGQTEETIGLDLAQHGERAYGGLLR